MVASKALLFAAVCAALALQGFGGSRGQTGFADTFELAEVPWTAGDVVHSTYSSNSTLRTTVTSQGQLVQEFDSIQEKHGAKTVRVLAADERGPQRIRIEYGALSSVEKRLDARSADSEESVSNQFDEHNPLQNRTFMLVRQNNTFRVLDANEARVPEGLARLVLEEEGVTGPVYLRAGDRVARELVPKALVVGVEIEISPESAAAFVDERGGPGEVRMWVTPKGARVEEQARVQVFATRLAIHSDGGSGRDAANIELAGEMRFDADSGRFLSIQLDGILMLESIAKDATRAIEVVGQGPWSIRESARYERSR